MNIVTRGLDKDSKYGLVTRGYGAVIELVEVVSAGGGTGRYARPTTKIPFLYLVDITGTVICKFELSIDIIGIKFFNFLATHELTASVIKEFILNSDINGILKAQFLQEIEAGGAKNTTLEEVIECLGTRSSDIFGTIEVKGDRLTEFEKENLLLGVKSIEINDKVIVKGKKDITEILFALGLLDTEEK